MILVPAVMLAAGLAALLIPAVYSGYALLALFFAVLYGGYYLYIFLKGFKKDVISLQKLFARAVQAERTVYESVELSYEFTREQVTIVYNGEGATRYFQYEDVSYIDETDRMYIVGIKKNPKKLNLYELDYILITKRALGEKETQDLMQLFKNLNSEYGVPLFEGVHPFR